MSTLYYDRRGLKVQAAVLACRMFSSRSVIAAVVVAGATIIACCGAGGTAPMGTSSPDTRAPAGSPSCGTTNAIFSMSPVALSDVVGWVPLGNMGPPGHTFPTDHQYLYLNDPGSASVRRTVDLMAPGDIIVTKAHLGTTNPGDVTDYTLEFSPCAETYAEFGHVLTIEPTLLVKVGPFDQFCNDSPEGV
jgi:hypothetical protein